MLTNFCWKLREPKNVIARKLYRALQVFVGADISSAAMFSNRPCFPHGMHGIFISGDAVIGKDAVIFQGVTIGSNTLADSQQGAPTIGNNCYIGAGACLIGPITIGDNVRIGANTTVHKDVPSNSVVVSSEQRVISREQPINNRFRTKLNGVWHYWQDGAFHKES